MRRLWPLLLWLAACETREVSVFEVPVGAPQGGGGANASGTSSGAGGTQAVVSGGGGSGNGGAGASNGGGGSGGTQGEVYGGGGSYDTGGSGGVPRPCTNVDDCEPGSACDLQGCDAPVGVCMPFISFCPDELKPVCGCDGVTYWNDCLRVSSGAVLAGQGQCSQNACPCDFGEDCEVAGASCSHLLPAGQMCGHGPGSCWMLPSSPASDKKRWRQCLPPDQGVLGPCVSTYAAIISEHSHVEARRDDPCN